MLLRPHRGAAERETRSDVIPAEVTYAACPRTSIHYTLSSPGGEIFAISPPNSHRSGKGDMVHAIWHHEDIRLVDARLKRGRRSLMLREPQPIPFSTRGRGDLMEEGRQVGRLKAPAVALASNCSTR